MERLGSIAAEQWGMVTAAQARRADVSRVDLGRLVADGSVVPVDDSARVYRIAGAPVDPDLDGVRAAWLQLGGGQSWDERIASPDAVVSHRSAAHVRDLGDLIPQAHELYVPRRRRLRRQDLRLHVRPNIRAATWSVYDGLPVSTVAETIRDLAAAHEDESAIAQVVTDAISRGLIDQEGVTSALGALHDAYGHASPDEFVATLTHAGDAA